MKCCEVTLWLVQRALCAAEITVLVIILEHLPYCASFQQLTATAYTTNISVLCLERVSGNRVVGGWFWSPLTSEIVQPTFHKWDILKRKLYSNNHVQADLKEGILCVVFSVMPGELECTLNSLFVTCVLFTCELKETASSTFYEYEE